MKNIPKYVMAVCGAGALVGLFTHGPVSTAAAAVAAVAIVVAAARAVSR
jgi:hypothetical protein